MYGEEEDDDYWNSSSRKKKPFFDDDDDDHGFAKNFAAQSRKSQIMDDEDDNDSLGALTGQATNDNFYQTVGPVFYQLVHTCDHTCVGIVPNSNSPSVGFIDIITCPLNVVGP